MSTIARRVVLRGLFVKIFKKAKGAMSIIRTERSTPCLPSLRYGNPILCSLVVLIAFITLSLSCQLSAQSTNGVVTGLVSDPLGNVVQGATITITDTQRNVTFKATTSQAGVYNISLPIGKYKERVEKQGFNTISNPAFDLELGQTYRFNFTLKVGSAATEVVEVSAEETPLLKEETAQLDTVIDTSTTESMPLATRNYVQMTLLIPGATHPDPTSMTSVQATQGGRPFINGNNEQSNNFLLDGLENNQISDNMIGYSPSIDAIQETTIITQNPSAEYGNFEGGTISTAIKSGTNKFHGNVFEFFRNDVLNASPWGDGFTNAQEKAAGEETTAVKPTVRWNMFGGTFGGPILHNKLFFFGDYQAQRYNVPSTTESASVLTEKMRAGDFSEILPGDTTFGTQNPGIQLYDPSTAIGECTKYPTTRCPLLNNNFANVAHPSTAFPGIDPAAKALFASGFYPLPTITNQIKDNLTYTQRTSTNADQGDVKVDYAVDDKNHIFARASKVYSTNPTITSVPVISSEHYSENWGDSGIAGWTHQITPFLFSDFRFGANYTKVRYGSDMDSLGNLANSIGITNGNNNSGQIVTGLPLISLGTGTQFNTLGSVNQAALFADTSIQANEEVTLMHKNHTVHMGFQYIRYRINTFYSGNSGENGSMSYSGVWTSGTGANSTTTGVGYGPADFLYGAPASIARGADNGTWGQRQSMIAAYVQDDWKIASNLTFNIGLRYDTHTPWTEVNGKQLNFDLNTGAPIFPSGGKATSALSALYGDYSPVIGSKSGYESYNLGWDFQPRLGFAWSPNLLHGKSVVRGAYAVTSYMEGMGTNGRLTENEPFVNNFSKSFIRNASSYPTQTTKAGFPDSLTASLDGFEARIWNSDFRPAVDNMWNLSIQHQLGNHDTAQIAYVGQKVTHIITAPNYAQFAVNYATGEPLPGPYLGQKAFNNTLTPSLFQVPGTNPNNQGGWVNGSASNGNQEYNALQATYQHRFTQGLEAQFSYTYGNCMADSIGEYGNNHGQSQPEQWSFQDQYNQKAEWGRCYYDVAQILTGYAVYSLPFGHKQMFGSNVNNVVDAIIGKWQLSGMTTEHTGYAQTANDNNVTPKSYGDSTMGVVRADRNGPVHYVRKFTGSGERFWDSTNFSDPQALTGYGNGSNGSIRGPGLVLLDLSLQKQFNVFRALHGEFRVEAINVLNHPIFQAPDIYYSDGDSAFGVTSGVNAAEGERQLQLGMKFAF
jgi:hypothetical protein